MNYIELQCTIKNEKLSTDIVIAYLSELNFESFTEEENVVRAYIKSQNFDISEIELLFKLKEITNKIELKHKTISQKNWNAEWESNYKPVVVENKCIVRTSFHNKPDNVEYDIQIEPKMSFGTGHHETTYLMLSFMLEINLQNKEILDMGCGTGVLSILASRKKAKSVLAVDIDYLAYENTLENARLNNVKNIKTQTGNINLIKEKNFQMIIANINRNVLLEQISAYSETLNKNGLLLISGFYNSDMKAIVTEAEKFDFQLINFKEKNNWVAVLFKK